VYDILEKNGPNVLKPQPKTPKPISFLQNLFGGFGILLLAGAALCFVAYAIHYYNHNYDIKESLWLGIALIFVDIISGCFSFYQVLKKTTTTTIKCLKYSLNKYKS
jgi:sodium/potassium-transporting ATPase subunit alpha